MHDTAPEDISGLCDEDEGGIRAMCGGGCIDVGNENVTCQQSIDRRSQGIITAHEIAQPTASGGISRVRHWSGLWVSDDERGAAGILILQQHQRRDSGINTAHDHGVSNVTKRSGNRGLRTVLDMQQ
jgi:hypothetical protein